MPYKDPEARRAHYAAYKETFKAKRRASYDANKPARNAQQRTYIAMHKEKINARRRARHMVNREADNAKKRVEHHANKAVNNAKSRAWHAANKERQKAYKHARYLANMEESRAKKRADYAAHREERIIKAMAYAATHRHVHRAVVARRRAQRLSAPQNDLTAAQWREILEHFDHRCVYCHRQMQRLTQDHILPLSKGGAHTVSNVVPACRSCNARKNAGPPLCPVQPLLLTIAPSKKK